MASTLFAGTSRYSSDFSQLIERSVAIASLPLRIMENQKAKLDAQATALTSINTKLTTLQSSIAALEKSFGSNSFTASVSDSNAASVSASDTALPGSWSVNVTSLGATTAFVVSGFNAVADPSSGDYLSAGAQSISVDVDPNDGLNNPEVIALSPSSRTLKAVVDEINTKAGSKVQATIVNTGTTSNPQYQLSLQSRSLGPVDITFKDDAVSSQNAVAQRGSLASYSVNGATVHTDAKSVTLAPGVTLDLKQTTSSAITVDVKRTANGLESALNNFISAYNTAANEVDSHRGSSGSALGGDSSLVSVANMLRGLMSATEPSGPFKSLADLGIGYDKEGRLTLDDTTFKKASESGLESLKTFFGTTTTSGLSSKLNGLVDSLVRSGSGALASAITTTQEASRQEGQRMAAQQERIDRMEDDLRERMAAADALIASLEQQASYFVGMFQAMRANNESYK